MSNSAQQHYGELFRPGSIGRLDLNNRLIMAPMGNALADGDGHVTDSMLKYYRERARGGVGLITTQCVSINREDMMPYSLALYDEGCIPGIKRLVEMIHEYEARVCIQLMHPGMLLVLLRSLPEGTTVKVPAMAPMMTGDKPYLVIEAADIERYIEDFATAARRAVETGADCIEIHACHGCLLSTFLSPATNRRADDYGGTVENRTRFTQRVIAAIRQRIGLEFPLTVRINGSDDVPGGVTPGEAVQQAVILNSAGVDAISISSGLEYWSALMAPPHSAPEGVNLAISETMKRILDTPVITAGKIGPELAVKVLREGKADFVALGRPLLADPELPKKLQEGRVDDIRRCVYCNNCLRSVWRSCSVNPFLYWEDLLPLAPAKTAKKVMVAGGGIAGMQAAILLAERGHRVSLFEKESELGGQWRIASALPEKRAYQHFTDYLKRRLEQLGIPVQLTVEVTREHVLEAEPDALVVATGAIPQGLDVPGLSLNHVVQANDVIQGKAHVADRVVVIGGNMLGMELATLLAAEGNRVILVSRGRLGGRKGPDEKTTFRILMRKLINAGVPVYPNIKIVEVVPHKLIVEMNAEILALPADTIALAMGVEPVSRLADEICREVPEVYTIGDCVVPGDAAQATYGAARLAAELA